MGNQFPDGVIAHTSELPPDVLKKYEAEGSRPVIPDLEGRPEFAGIRLTCRNFLRASGEAARHDSALLARAIFDEYLAPLEASRVRKSLRPVEACVASPVGLSAFSTPSLPPTIRQANGT